MWTHKLMTSSFLVLQTVSGRRHWPRKTAAASSTRGRAIPAYIILFTLIYGSFRPHRLYTVYKVKFFPRATWPIRQRWSPILSPSARHQPKLQYHGHGPLCFMVCLFTPRAYAGTKLYCLVTEANVCERLVCKVALTAQLQRPYHCATKPHCV